MGAGHSGSALLQVYVKLPETQFKRFKMLLFASLPIAPPRCGGKQSHFLLFSGDWRIHEGPQGGLSQEVLNRQALRVGL